MASLVFLSRSDGCRRELKDCKDLDLIAQTCCEENYLNSATEGFALAILYAFPTIADAYLSWNFSFSPASPIS